MVDSCCSHLDGWIMPFTPFPWSSFSPSLFNSICLWQHSIQCQKLLFAHPYKIDSIVHVVRLFYWDGSYAHFLRNCHAVAGMAPARLGAHLARGLGICHGAALFRVGKALINGRQKVMGVGTAKQDGYCQSLGHTAQNARDVEIFFC